MKEPRYQLARVLAKRSLKTGGGKKFAREVAAYLLDNSRVNELDSIIRDIQEDWARDGYVEATAISAHPLTAGVKSDIKSKVRQVYPKAKKIIITEERDPDVVGGVKIELANQQLDLSIRHKLNKFKQLTAGD